MLNTLSLEKKTYEVQVSATVTLFPKAWFTIRPDIKVYNFFFFFFFVSWYLHVFVVAFLTFQSALKHLPLLYASLMLENSFIPKFNS